MSKRPLVRVDVNTPGTHIGEYWYPKGSIGWALVEDWRAAGFTDREILKKLVKYRKGDHLRRAISASYNGEWVR